MKRGWFILAVVVIAMLVLIARSFTPLLVTGRTGSYVGAQACLKCHKEQHELWAGSDHAMAMLPATAQSVRGDFNNSVFTEENGDTVRFEKRGEKFFFAAKDKSGKTTEHEVKYTFGYRPLQQYLFELPGGRMNALTVAWDTENKKWYSLYPDQKIAPDDWLHWSQRGQSWNSNCAECHSTNLRKGYDAKSDTYKTTWSEINVSCEACHGPGSGHVAWAEASSLSRFFSGYNGGTKGLTHSMRDPKRAWGWDKEGKPKLLAGSSTDPRPQVENCAACHSRRGPVSESPLAGKGYASLLDEFVPQLLQESIYHPDGQILEEDYEYGSFVQSKMHAHGVRCSDCHNPHSGKLLALGNALCTRCHLPPKYDTVAHHRHLPTSTGSQCVECHMPGKLYMVADYRRDHSLRIPRPDLSHQLATPDACSACHKDKDAKWAADAATQWWPKLKESPHYGTTFAAAWSGKRDAGDDLVKLLNDPTRAGFVRASAAAALQGFLSPGAIQAAEKSLKDPDPQVRLAAVSLMAVLPEEQRVTFVAPLLNDMVRAVRQAAARLLATTPRKLLKPDQTSLIETTLTEQEQALLAHSDNVMGRLALGALYQDLNRHDDALREYRVAIAMDPQHIDAKMATAELLISMNRDKEAEPLLREIAAQPKPKEVAPSVWARAQGSIRYQLGLLLAADPRRAEEGVKYLREATELIPTAARLYYNLGLALNGLGKVEEAERALLRGTEIEPENPNLLYALATFNLEHGRHTQAFEYAQRLRKLHPTEEAYLELENEIRRQALERVIPK